MATWRGEAIFYFEAETQTEAEEYLEERLDEAFGEQATLLSVEPT